MKIKLIIIGLIITTFSCNSGSGKKELLSPRFNHIVLYVSDMETSVKFYTTAFDLKVSNESAAAAAAAAAPSAVRKEK